MTPRLVFLTISAAMSAMLAVADNGLPSDAPTTISSPPTEFVPLTSSERLSHYLQRLVDSESILRSAASAGIRQADGKPKEWGGGAEGYGLRLGNAYAQHFIRQTLQYGASAALHEDNRYFVSGQTGAFRRIRYAVKNTFLARHDNGSQSFSFSRIGSAAGAAFISRSWQPPSSTTAGDGATSFGITMASDIGFNVFREFWPDIRRHLHKE